MPLSSGERIILFLGQSDRATDIDVGLDQREISVGCCIGRTHVPRSLKPLVEGGQVSEDKKRIPGMGRMVKRYRLTIEGISAMRSLRERLRSMRISLVGPDGLKNTMDPFSVLSLVNTYLGNLSMGPVLLTQMLSLESDPITWDEVSELSRASTDQGSLASLPPGWEPIPPPSLPDMWINVVEDEMRLRDMISSEGLVVVQGPFGSGKRTMTSKVLGSLGFKALWIARADPDRQSVLKEAVDALVMVDGSGPGTFSLISASCQEIIHDPRGEEWDEELRGLPLIVINTGNDPLNAQTFYMAPIPLEVYIQAISSLGLDIELIRAIHGATGGTPLVLRMLHEMDGEALQKIITGSRDEVVFRILLMVKDMEGG